MIDSTDRDLFNADHHAFRDTVRRFLGQVIAPNLDRHETDGIVERDAWEKAGAAGLLETSAAGVYAVGDVRAGSTKRAATAVDEGAAVVGYVHQHLAEVPA